MTNQFTGISDEDLLAELIKRNELAAAPTRSVYASGHSQIIVGIGKDEVASIVIHEEGVKYLNIKPNS